jgi:hypothetical protein
MADESRLGNGEGARGGKHNKMSAFLFGPRFHQHKPGKHPTVRGGHTNTRANRLARSIQLPKMPFHSVILEQRDSKFLCQLDPVVFHLPLELSFLLPIQINHNFTSD